MSADILRRAASLMRERAEAAHAATPDPLRPDGAWVVKPHRMRLDCTTIQTRSETFVAHYVIDGAAEHIASWHPAVALAVADWLHTAAADIWAHGPLCECGTGCDACDDNLWEPHARDALTVARTYLGEAS